MELNKIHRYYGITQDNSYPRFKEILQDAFNGFDGVSFETIEATEADPEKFLIHLDEDGNSTFFLELTIEAERAKIFICFEGYRTGLSEGGSEVKYLNFNVFKSRYGVAFSRAIRTNSYGPTTSNFEFTSFFCCQKNSGNENVFINTTGGANNIANVYRDNRFYSTAHESPEIYRINGIPYAIATPMIKLNQVSSANLPVTCKHLYQLEFSNNQSGETKVEDKYFMIGALFALEYDPTDDDTEN